MIQRKPKSMSCDIYKLSVKDNKAMKQAAINYRVDDVTDVNLIDNIKIAIDINKSTKLVMPNNKPTHSLIALNMLLKDSATYQKYYIVSSADVASEPLTNKVYKYIRLPMQSNLIIGVDTNIKYKYASTILVEILPFIVKDAINKYYDINYVYLKITKVRTEGINDMYFIRQKLLNIDVNSIIAHDGELYAARLTENNLIIK